MGTSDPGGDRPPPAAGPAALEAVSAPLCEVGCAASTFRRLGVDMLTELLGSEWSLETSTRRLGRLPQRFIERTEVSLSAQGRGWRAASVEVAGVAVGDLRADRPDYLAALRAALAAGGAVLIVDDFHVPWLDYSGRSHGLLPHALALSQDHPAAGEMSVVEGHSWWSGVYRLSYPELLTAAFPDEDVHGISGRYLAFEPALREPAERLRPALDRLRVGCERTSAGSVDSDETPWGTVTTALGEPAIQLAQEGYGGFRYACRLTEDAAGGGRADLARDADFGSYVLQRLADELAFLAHSREGTARLLSHLPGSAEVVAPVAAVVLRWRAVWRQARELAARPRAPLLDTLIRDFGHAGREDLRVAAMIAESLRRHPS